MSNDHYHVSNLKSFLKLFTFVFCRDGRLQESDHILAIDKQVLDSTISHKQAIYILQGATGLVELVIARGAVPRTDQSGSGTLDTSSSSETPADMVVSWQYFFRNSGFYP
jgi:hypothetical protein